MVLADLSIATTGVGVEAVPRKDIYISPYAQRLIGGVDCTALKFSLTAVTCDFRTDIGGARSYAAWMYSLINPPRIGGRLICFASRSMGSAHGFGGSGRGLRLSAPSWNGAAAVRGGASDCVIPGDGAGQRG
jgi:hypothetical protein